MNNHTKRKIWQTPWSYPESVAFCLGLFVIGMMLQLTVGPLSSRIFTFPNNITIGVAYLVVLAITYAFARKSEFVRWLSSTSTAITSILCLGVVVILMGITPQREIVDGHAHSVISSLGLDIITRTWYFGLLYFFLLSILGLTIFRKAGSLSLKNIGFVLNHLGLWIVLFAGVLGSGDLARMTMTVYEGKIEWRVRDANNHVFEMPIAVQLNDFRMEEYPPKLFFINTKSGSTLPIGKPQSLAIESNQSKGMVLGWEIVTKRLIADAAPVNASKFEHVLMQGTCPAAFITARNLATNEVISGWVSSGSFVFPHKALYLNDTLGVVMELPEPKRFESEVIIYTKDGKQASAIIEVNKPVTINGWKLYQLGYNEAEGKWSSYSTIEFVRDPWLPIVYVGLILLLLGSMYMFWMANKQNRGNHVE